jgi:hypothetical protein
MGLITLPYPLGADNVSAEVNDSPVLTSMELVLARTLIAPPVVGRVE